MNEIITISSLSYGSAGIGNLKSGKVVFVNNTVPGDMVEIEIIQSKNHYSIGKVVNIIEKSPIRVDGLCPICGICGGCPWMHIKYENQLSFKKTIIKDQYDKAIKIKDNKLTRFESVVPSKQTLGFRNKLELSTIYENNKFCLGFHKQNSYEIIRNNICYAGVNKIKNSPKRLSGAIGYLANNTHTKLNIYRIGIRHSENTNDTEIALWTPPGSFPHKFIAHLLQNTLNPTSIVRVIANQDKRRLVKKVEVIAGKGYWSEKLNNFTYRVSAPSFFQVNTLQAQHLSNLVLDYLDLPAKSKIADLYCGIGTFTLPLAKRYSHIYAIESEGSAIRDLKHNLNKAKLNAHVIGGDVARELPTLGQLDATIIDPPRSGLSKSVIKGMKIARPKKIIYISCNPSTWARDVAYLKNIGYNLVSATPVDMFPQTFHIETVSLLQYGKI